MENRLHNPFNGWLKSRIKNILSSLSFLKYYYISKDINIFRHTRCKNGPPDIAVFHCRLFLYTRFRRRVLSHIIASCGFYDVIHKRVSASRKNHGRVSLRRRVFYAPFRRNAACLSLVCRKKRACPGRIVEPQFRSAFRPTIQRQSPC